MLTGSVHPNRSGMSLSALTSVVTVQLLILSCSRSPRLEEREPKPSVCRWKLAFTRPTSASLISILERAAQPFSESYPATRSSLTHMVMSSRIYSDPNKVESAGLRTPMTMELTLPSDGVPRMPRRVPGGAKTEASGESAVVSSPFVVLQNVESVGYAIRSLATFS